MSGQADDSRSTTSSEDSRLDYEPDDVPPPQLRGPVTELWKWYKVKRGVWQKTRIVSPIDAEIGPIRVAHEDSREFARSKNTVNVKLAGAKYGTFNGCPATLVFFQLAYTADHPRLQSAFEIRIVPGKAVPERLGVVDSIKGLFVIEKKPQTTPSAAPSSRPTPSTTQPTLIPAWGPNDLVGPVIQVQRLEREEKFRETADARFSTYERPKVKVKHTDGKHQLAVHVTGPSWAREGLPIFLRFGFVIVNAGPAKVAVTHRSPRHRSHNWSFTIAQRPYSSARTDALPGQDRITCSSASGSPCAPTCCDFSPDHLTPAAWKRLLDLGGLKGRELPSGRDVSLTGCLDYADDISRGLATGARRLPPP